MIDVQYLLKEGNKENTYTVKCHSNGFWSTWNPDALTYFLLLISLLQSVAIEDNGRVQVGRVMHLLYWNVVTKNVNNIYYISHVNTLPLSPWWHLSIRDLVLKYHMHKNDSCCLRVNGWHTLSICLFKLQYQFTFCDIILNR